MGVIAGLVAVANEALRLSRYLPYAPTVDVVAQALALAGAVAVAAAFTASLRAFLDEGRRSRAGLLAIAAGLFGIYGAANFVGRLIQVIGAPSQPWAFLTAQSASIAEPFFLLVAALLLAVAVLSSRRRLLGGACVALALSFAMSATAYAFSVVGDYEIGGFFRPSGRIVAAFVTTGAGYSVCAIAALVGAVALFTGGSRRYRRLAIASALFVAGFLTVTGGVIVIATGGVDAALSLTAAFPFVLAAAAAVGVAAFRSLEQSDGADLPVLPDPA